MGLRGPLPKPVTLKLLAGNPGKRGAASPRRLFAEGTPVCPAWLGAEAKAEWKRLAKELKESGILSIVDRAALTAYCQAWGDMVETTKTLDTEGRIIEQPIQNAKGEVIGMKKIPHPAIRLHREATARVKTFLNDFGFSPASRRRLGDGGGTPAAEQGKPKNRLDAIKARRGGTSANG